MTTVWRCAQVCAIMTALALAACGEKPAPPMPMPSQDAVRRVEQGELIGFKSPEGALVWRGVRFAASTAGDNRWRAPRPPEKWSGVHVAANARERCPQITNGFHQSEGLEPGELIGSEDCLFLDIYAPPMSAGDSARADLPVMVWIHGGGNIWGSSRAYDGSALALNENVIVVAVQYRMGPLGWFANQAIRDSAATPDDAGANFGTLDIIAALGWVKSNIEAFGGDAGNVTIFGESAGGHNVASLMASTRAAGLFQRAIMQSGSFDSVSLDAAENGPGPNTSRAIADQLGVQTARDLRAASVEDLYAALEADQGLYDLPLIIEDGVVLPSQPLREAAAAPGGVSDAPLITGTNRDEIKLFLLLDPEMTRRFLKVFLFARDQDYYDAVSDYMSRLWKLRSVDEPASAMAAAGKDNVYAYRFDWDEGGRFLVTDLSRLLGAAHAMEIPFVFNSFHLLGDLDPVMFKKKTKDSREALAGDMGVYWAEFARNGAPGGSKALPEWPRWGASGARMRFDSAADGGPEVIVGVDSLDALFTDLKTDQRLDDKQRCRIAEAMGARAPAELQTYRAMAGCA